MHVWIEDVTSEALFLFHSALKPELAEKLRMLINIHGPIAPKPRPTPLTMPGLGMPPGSTPSVSVTLCSIPLGLISFPGHVNMAWEWDLVTHIHVHVPEG